MSRMLASLGILIFLFVLALAIFSCLTFLVNTKPPRYNSTITPFDYGLEYQSFIYNNDEKVKISGWFIPGKKDFPAIYLCHGLGADKGNLLDLGVFLNKAGYAVVLYDLRAHGESSGRCSFGYLETKDLIEIIKYVFENFLENQNSSYCGILGVSMGASAAIMAAAQDSAIRAVVAESPYLDFQRCVDIHSRLMLGFIGKITNPVISITYKLFFGKFPKEVSPYQMVSKAQHCTFLFIGGSEDHRMPLADIQKIHQKALKSQLWAVSGADHCEAFYTSKLEYKEKVLKFFEENLLQNN